MRIKQKKWNPWTRGLNFSTNLQCMRLHSIETLGTDKNDPGKKYLRGTVNTHFVLGLPVKPQVPNLFSLCFNAQHFLFREFPNSTWSVSQVPSHHWNFMTLDWPFLLFWIYESHFIIWEGLDTLHFENSAPRHCVYHSITLRCVCKWKCMTLDMSLVLKLQFIHLKNKNIWSLQTLPVLKCQKPEVQMMLNLSLLCIC